jgi:hypothetical protein
MSSMRWAESQLLSCPQAGRTPVRHARLKTKIHRAIRALRHVEKCLGNRGEIPIWLPDRIITFRDWVFTGCNAAQYATSRWCSPVCSLVPRISWSPDSGQARTGLGQRPRATSAFATWALATEWRAGSLAVGWRCPSNRHMPNCQGSAGGRWSPVGVGHRTLSIACRLITQQATNDLLRSQTPTSRCLPGRSPAAVLGSRR